MTRRTFVALTAAAAAVLLSGCTAADRVAPGAGAALESVGPRIADRVDDAIAIAERFNDELASDYDTFQGTLAAAHKRLELGRCRWPHTMLERWCGRSEANQARCVAACNYLVQPGRSATVKPRPAP